MIYLIEFSAPLGNSKHEANYYLGYCEDGRELERFREHCNGVGAKITAAAVSKGIGLRLVATFPGTRKDERRLKNWNNHKKVLATQRRKGVVNEYSIAHI